MKKDFTPTSKELRDWADNPAASRMVPVSPTSLRAVADLLDAQAAEIAALKNDRDGWHQQASGRIDDALQFASERDEARAEIAALKAGLAVMRDCFPTPAAAGALEDAWAEAMSMPECIPAYVVACVANKDAEIAALRSAIGTVCEGWTLPHDARKILESALWPAIAQAVQPADHTEDALAMVRPVVGQAVQPK